MVLGLEQRLADLPVGALEPGTQGEHKVARGFEPTTTHSAHRIADPRFARAIADYLKKNRVETIQGSLRFDGPSNYGDDLMRIKQVQNGKWQVVWPREYAAPGTKLIAP